MKTQAVPGWQMELTMNALGIIGNIAATNGYTDDAISTSAIASVLASAIDQAYSIGLCIGADSKDDKEERIDRHCFRNLN